MKKISVSLEADHVDRLDTIQEDHEYITSRSEALRHLLTRYEELLTECEEYEATITERETTIERLQNEKRLILEERETKNELVEYVETELSYRDAGLATRAKWWLFGRG